MAVNGVNDSPFGHPALKRAYENEREAEKKIEASNKRVAAEEKRGRERLDYVREEYARLSENESVKYDQNIQTQKQDHYKRMLELKREQARDEARLRRAGERNIDNIREYFSTVTENIKHRGKQAVRSQNSQIQTQLKHNKRTAENQVNNVQQQSLEHYETVRQRHVDRMKNLHKSATEEYNRTHNNYTTGMKDTKGKFLDKHKAYVDQSKEILNKLRTAANDKLMQKRDEYSTKLDAYSERQQDPFYKLVKLDADLDSNSDEFILTARIPKHEQDHIQVSMRGNELVVTGQRSNMEELELEPGRKQTTHSFQSFSESFPLDWPVEERYLSKEFDGDQLTIRVPKKSMGGLDAPRYKSDRHVEQAQAPRPRFPENLPLPGPENKSDDDSDSGDSDKKGPISGPLA